MKDFLTIGILLLVIVFGPLATIWALNTLFGFNIEYNIATWFAALWLSSIVHGTSTNRSK